jgi:hypothetical protein
MMLNVRRGYTICLFLVAAVFLLTPCVHGKGYKGFLLLNPDECVPLDEKVVLQLPVEWHKYSDFIKICGLTQKKGQPAKVSIISVWADDCHEAQPAGAEWEEFPRPIVVDTSYRQLGQLPELYPTHQESELSVYYGKWRSGTPEEIRVDVHNPAVDGDYYYAPLVWNGKQGRYEIKKGGDQRTYGRRLK